MNINDIMVGSHILYEGNIITVQPEDLQSIRYNPDEYAPIKLTRDILVKSGFTHAGMHGGFQDGDIRIELEPWDKIDVLYPDGDDSPCMVIGCMTVHMFEFLYYAIHHCMPELVIPKPKRHMI